MPRLTPSRPEKSYLHNLQASTYKLGDNVFFVFTHRVCVRKSHCVLFRVRNLFLVPDFVAPGILSFRINI